MYAKITIIKSESYHQAVKEKIAMSIEFIELCQRLKQSLDALFNPFIRVVPEKDWSKIKAIWIPFLHHDANNQLQKSEKITIVQPSIDKFGTIQGYLTAPNENYIPYLTTFFSPTLTQDQVIEKIAQAHQNILETEQIVTDATGEHIIRKTVIGVAKSGMMISIVTNQDDKIIDAFPIFDAYATPITSGFRRNSSNKLINTK